jgi:hypothetical protein
MTSCSTSNTCLCSWKYRLCRHLRIQNPIMMSTSNNERKPHLELLLVLSLSIIMLVGAFVGALVDMIIKFLCPPLVGIDLLLITGTNWRLGSEPLTEMDPVEAFNEERKLIFFEITITHLMTSCLY